jgi:hypothetical protein
MPIDINAETFWYGKGGPKAALSLSALGDKQPAQGSLRGAKVRAARLLSQLETTAVSPPFSLIHSSIWTESEWRAGRSAFIGLKIG